MNKNTCIVHYLEPPYTIQVYERNELIVKKTANTLEEIWEIIENIEPIHLTLYHNKTFDEIYGNQDSWGDFLYYRFGHSPMFPIQDRNAKIVFKPKFLIDDMTNAGNSAITYLDWSNQNLEDISDLINYQNVIELDLRNNAISDITVLGVLIELRSLALQHNKIKDIRPLFALKKLEFVNLSHNYVSVADQQLLEKTLPECMFGF